MHYFFTFRERIIHALEKAIIVTGYESLPITVEYPDVAHHGDYSSNIALQMAKATKQNPRKLAETLISALRSDRDFTKWCDRMEIAGPGFINFFVSEKALGEILVSCVQNKDTFGNSNWGAGKKIVIEYSQPNTNKPLHLGHLRNNFLGMALGNLLKARGYTVVMTEIVNDRGIHICKSMLAYQKWGNGETPESAGMKGDHLVGKYYVAYSVAEKKDPGILTEAREMLLKWEAGDEAVRSLWRTMNDWTLQGYEETYRAIGSHFDYKDFESDIYAEGKAEILRALEAGAAHRVEGGAIAVDLSSHALGGRSDGNKILIRSDGTAMYITQDIYLAIKRYREQHPDRVIYVVANEQDYHFKVLFKILELFGHAWAGSILTHFSYGMVELPEGKMKSREGTVVDADDLIEDVTHLAKEEIEKRHELISESEADTRARFVALAALKFYLLKADARSVIVFNPSASVDFEGATGPYIQYTYARLASILRRATDTVDFSHDTASPDSGYAVHEDERKIMLLIARFPEIVSRAGDELAPHILAEYLLQVASGANSWYASSPVLTEPEPVKAFRINLVRGVRSVLGRGLELLGIQPLEQM